VKWNLPATTNIQCLRFSIAVCDVSTLAYSGTLCSSWPGSGSSWSSAIFREISRTCSQISNNFFNLSSSSLGNDVGEDVIVKDVSDLSTINIWHKSYIQFNGLIIYSMMLLLNLYTNIHWIRLLWFQRSRAKSRVGSSSDISANIRVQSRIV